MAATIKRISMRKYVEKIITWGVYLYIFLLPWQTRWIWHQGFLNGQPWEFGTFCVYGTDIIFLIILLLFFFLPRHQIKNAERFSVLALIFFLICFISVFWANNKDIAWYSIGRLAMAAILFWMVLKTELKWTRLAVSFVLSGVLQSVIAIVQFFSQHIIANKWLGIATHSPEVLGDSVVGTATGRFLRAYGSLPSPNVLGGWLVVCLLVLVGLIFYIHRDRRAQLWQVLLSTAAFSVMFLGLIATFSRSAWISFGVAMLAMLCISIWTGDTFRAMIWARMAIWIVLLMTFSIIAFPELWQTRILSSGRLEAASVTERVTRLNEATIIITQNWAPGVGVGNYTQALYNNDTSKDVWDYQPTHNIYLLITAETGIFGGLIFILLVFEFMRSSFGVIRKKREKIDDWFLVLTMVFLALMIIGLLDHYLWTLSFGLVLFWLTLGLWVKQWLIASQTDSIHTLVDKLFHRQT
jgi:O-antigen ligase